MFLIIVGLNACKDSTPSNGVAFEYFDNPAFFKKEIDRLNSSKINLLKTVETDDKQEQHRISNVDWEKELSIFSSITLNKSSYSGKYKIDSCSTLESTHFDYTATDLNLPIQRFAFTKKSGVILSIEASKKEHSNLMNTEVSWRYIPDSGYVVSGIQKVAGLSESKYRVSAIFVNTIQ